MILDKSTGDLIIDENHIIKAGMSIEEIKNSNIKDLLTEDGKRNLEAERHPYLLLKRIVVDGADVDINLNILSNKVIKITFNVDDASRKCHFNQDYVEFGELVEKNKALMRKMLDVKYIDEDVDFQGGYAVLDSEIRSPSVRIRINYLYENEAK
ncbi:hypothetical protein LGK95_09105 [Clostridium algoriphilum]|uniref:hypothetical protein n=1 Tax=Clostridium algoriphilum TaxID=198347 RepID=UPI001CF1D3DA|nr:hypothetical protein [Clostridium algoriphilum]MCB2293681.1 hypothetical protein [Clostridium algoriphilum]